MKHHQITASMAKDIAFKLGAELNNEEAEIFADGYNAAMLKVNKNASTELPNDANLSTSSQAEPDDSGLLPCPFCGSPAEHYPDGDMEGYIIMCGNKNGDCNLQAFGFATPEEAEKAWNTRAAMLQGIEPVSQTYNLPELIEGMEVSIDVSTCDADAGNRYFGTVTEVSELYTAKNGYILLVQDAKPNFDVNGNTPVQSPIDHGYRPECECSGCKATARICAELAGSSTVIGIDPASGPDRTVEVHYVAPPGYVMVPNVPTDEMIAAAMNCEDVLFNSDESFCVQFGNIYEAMLAAAPQHEVK
ncbi:Lar family restriction alleviation protein [Salmonella enterica]